MPPSDADGRLIDLGVLAAEPPGDPGRAAAPTSRGRRARTAARYPAVAAAALAVLVLVGVGGSAHVAGPRQLSMVDLPGSGPVPVGDQGGRLSISAGLLTAFDPSANATRAFTLGREVRAWPQAVAGPVYSISTGYALSLGDRCTDGDPLLDVRDARDGRRLWRFKGLPIDQRDGVLLTVARTGRRCEPAGPDGAPPTAGALAVRAYDVADGRPRWAAPVAPLSMPAIGVRDGRAVVYAIAPDGTWLLRDLRGGDPLGPSGQPAEPPPLPRVPAAARDAGTRRHVYAEGPVVVTLSARAFDGGDLSDSLPFSVDAYDPVSLRRTWGRAAGADPSLPAWIAPVPCGQLICLNQPGGIEALDAGGRMRWHADEVQAVRRAGAHWVLAASTGALQPSSRYDMVVDTRTGRTVLRFGLWQVVVPPRESDPLPARLLVYRWTERQTWFGVLDLDRGATQPVLLGWVPGQQSGCVSAGRYVACGSIRGTAGLWRLDG